MINGMFVLEIVSEIKTKTTTAGDDVRKGWTCVL